MKHFKLSLIAAFSFLLTLSAFAKPENLWIIGGPFNAHKPNWLFRDIVKLEKSSENAAVFYYRGYIGYNTFGDEPGNFKILTTDNSWDGYHPDGSVNQQIGATQVGQTLSMRFGGDDTKWFIPEDRSGDGYYVIKIDTENNTFLIESFTAASSADYPVGLFCVGGPFIINNGAWSPDEAKKLERDDADPDVFHFRGYLEHNQWGSEPGNFKILVNARDWSDAFHPGGTEDNVALSSAVDMSLAVRHGGADNKWFLPEDGSGNGYWEFSVDARNLTIRVDSFVHDFDYFDHVYIAGSAMPCGWNSAEPEVMNKVSEGVYTWTGTVAAGEFKFLKFLNSWSRCYVAVSSGETVGIDHLNSVVYEKNYAESGNDYKFVVDEQTAGKDVTITLNLADKTMEVKSVISSVVNPADNLSVDIRPAKGKALVSGMASETYTARVFSMEGMLIRQVSFDGNTGIELPQGYYLVSVSDGSGLIAKTKIVIF